MHEAKIITHYNNKGDDLNDCNNHKGISLLSDVVNVSACVAQKLLCIIAEKVRLESESGFKALRSIGDIIFTGRQLQEKYMKQGNSA